MEVILLKDVEKLGKKGDVLNVREGFGRNFLLPRILAVQATFENRSRMENEKRLLAGRKGREKSEAEKLAQGLESLSLRLEVATGEKDKLYGSVTTQDLAKALKDKGFALHKRQIHPLEPLRSLGKHSVTLELHPEVKPTIQVEVVKKKA